MMLTMLIEAAERQTERRRPRYRSRTRGRHRHHATSQLRSAGADAVLVGEPLMRASDPTAVIEDLVRA